ncbi:MAG: CotH kinase family protein [Lachnospiraceae bacterium]|nr:CotH kinase family protein [Lachnospiraceae bacterium]
MMSRKNALFCLLLICGALCLLLLYDKYERTELTFSRESGFYEEPFELKLSAPIGTKIYYTLDGSVPDENAFLYTSPIVIDDATSHPNVYSMRTDMAYETATGGVSYKSPDYPIDKCTVVRAVYQDMDGSFNDLKTESYFIGYNGKTGYSDMNVISVVTDPDNLFDYDNGIYVLGRRFDTEFDEDGNHADATENFVQHGFTWERPADIQLFNADRESVLKQSCGIRIQGGGSRARLPKSLNLYARESYGMAKRFYADLFGTGYMADTLTLSMGGQDEIAKFRDMFVAELTGERNFCTMNFEPCVMFLDGEYWGVYWLTERYTDTYVGHYYNVDKDNVLIVKNGRPETESDEDWSTYTSMMNYLNDVDFTVAENYEALSYVIDLQSYLDYYATEIYIGRGVDWPGGTNEAFWRVRNPVEDGKGGYEDGRWRWMLFDVNTSSLEAVFVADDTLAFVMEYSTAFNNLCRSDKFKEAFTVTLMDMANEIFSPVNTEPIIERHLDLMTEPIDVHLKRFFGSEPPYRPEDEMVNIREFLANRKPYIAGCLKADFGLEGELAPVEIKTTDAAAGSVVLNTITPTFDEQGRWQGEYFTDYPITLSVTVNEGYRFVGWEVDAGEGHENIGEASLQLEIPKTGLYLRAVFDREEQGK